MPDYDPDERFSLHPADPDEVLRKLLRVPPTDAEGDEAEDEDEEPTEP
jgi:hypothetical protein